jgi:hypothetical protein
MNTLEIKYHVIWKGTIPLNKIDILGSFMGIYTVYYVVKFKINWTISLEQSNLFECNKKILTYEDIFRMI